eukprot:1527716-Rhodomonas_salina.3
MALNVQPPAVFEPCPSPWFVIIDGRELRDWQAPHDHSSEKLVDASKPATTDSDRPPVSVLTPPQTRLGWGYLLQSE